NFQVTNNLTIWVRLQIINSYNCFKIAPINFQVYNLPLVSTLQNVSICGEYILPTIDNGKYYTQPNGQGTQLFAGNAINTTTTLYIYNQNENCSNQSSFNITIINNANHFNTINACNAYTLAQIPYGNVYTGPNGTGTVVTAGTTFTSNQTLYHYHVVNGIVCSNYSFQINVTIMPTFENFDNLRIFCSPYTLPALAFGQYFTQPNGGGIQLFPGDIIYTSQTIYVFYQLNGCKIEKSFEVIIVENTIANLIGCGKVVVPYTKLGQYYTLPNGGGQLLPTGTELFQNTTIYLNIDWDGYNCSFSNPSLVIINPIPVVDNLANVVTCSSYTLPQLNSGNYFTSPNGGGIQLQPGAEINSNKTIYIYINNGTCVNQSSFEVKVIPTNFQNINACLEYTIPNNLYGKFYQNPNGVDEIPVGTVINTSQTIYFYSNQITTTPNCTNNIPIQITIHYPQLMSYQDIYTCSSYTLPNLENAQYYTNSNGNGNIIPAGTVIQENKTIYIYNPNSICNSQSSFNVYIVNTNFQNIQSCGTYILPTLPYGNFFTEPNGNGTLIPFGQEITSSQMIYYYVNTNFGANCTLNTSFYVEILPLPLVSVIENVNACETFTLPAIENGNYFTLENGQGNQLTPGTVISSSQTIYIYNNNGVCDNQSSFTITLFSKPNLINFTDINVCFNYTLPQLPAGASYYTESNGNGENLPAGTVISQNKVIYILVRNPNLPSCYIESPFSVYILGVKAPQLENVNVCDSYVLPQLTIGKYYTQPNKGGQNLLPGTTLTQSQLVYIHVSNNNRISCNDETSFMVNITSTPILGEFTDVFGCGSYKLPTLATGNYFTLPN
ncbi:MAG: hypothetical protein ACOVOV_07970, partial [Dolichospermum sp.]